MSRLPNEPEYDDSKDADSDLDEMDSSLDLDSEFEELMEED